MTGPGRTHQNAVAVVAYDTRPVDGWPMVDNQSSIWRHDLTGDPNVGASWTRADPQTDTVSWNASPIFQTVIDHEGGDVGSPGVAPLILPSLIGDYNSDDSVDAADYVVWRKNGGPSPEYEAWRASFGMTSLGGGGLERPSTVPEPAGTTIAWAFAALLAALNRRVACPRSGTGSCCGVLAAKCAGPRSGNVIRQRSSPAPRSPLRSAAP